MACKIFLKTEQFCYKSMFFANLQLSELLERGQSLSNNPQSKWQPWAYKFREEVAKKVTQFKEKQGKPIKNKHYILKYTDI